MAPLGSIHTSVAADFDVLQNRVALALAKRERLVESWTALSSRQRPPDKTQEQLDAEDAELFRFEPPHLGLGAPIPKEYLEGDVKRTDIASNEKLRHLILGNKSGFKGSKPRDAQEKFGSAKRGLKELSSDEDEGRSALGRAKKSKNEGSSSTKSELPGEIKVASRQNGIPLSSHRSLSGANALAVDKTAPVLSQNTSPLLAKEKDIFLKKPLVDYPSDDSDDDDGYTSEKVSSDIVPQKQERGPASASPNPSSFSLQTGVDTTRKTESESKIGPSKSFNKKLMSPPIPPSAAATGMPKHSGSESGPMDGKVHPKNAPSKSGSSHTSSKRSSRGSSSDSEPSDMETAIPLALNSDVLVLPSIPSTISTAEEAKRAKKRQKRARKREREQQQKALALANNGAGKSVAASIPGPTVAKKLKDRLLDANGN